MRHRYNRSWYTSYLSGANQLIAEAGAVNLFLQKIQLDDDGNATGEGPGVMELSPLGHVARDFSHFVRARSGHALLIYSVYIYNLLPFWLRAYICCNGYCHRNGLVWWLQ